MTESIAAPQRRPGWWLAAVTGIAIVLLALAIPPWGVLPPIVLLPLWWLLLPLLSHAAAGSLQPPLPAGDDHGRRLVAGAIWIWAHAALLALLLAPAVQHLLATPRLSAALLLAAAGVLALLLPWRLWPALLLPEHDEPARAGERPRIGRLLARSLRAARALTGTRDLYLSHGLPALLLHAMVVLAPAALLWAPTPTSWLYVAPPTLVLVGLAWWLYRHLHARVRRLLAPVAAPEGADQVAGWPIPDNALLRAAALRAALREGDIDHALALIGAGVDPVAPALPDEGDQRDALVIAATLNDSRPLRALIGAGADVNHRCQELTPLLAATRDSYYGRAEIVLALIANGARLDDLDGAGRSPLHHAALSAEPAVAAMLLDAGASIDRLDAEGWTPLALACAAGNQALVAVLLERRAQPAPEGARPALCAAAGAAEDNAALVGLLLRARAGAGALDPDGASALHLAAAAGNVVIARALLAAGAEVDCRDAAARTPLHLACAQFDPDAEIIAVLAAAGADASIADAEGVTATELQARRRGGMDAASGACAHGNEAPSALLAAGHYNALRAWLLAANPAQRAGLALEAALQGASRAMADALAAPLGSDPVLADDRNLVDTALAQLPGSLPLLAALPSAGVSVAGGARLARLLSAPGLHAESVEPVALGWLDAGADPFADPGGASPLHHAAGLGLPALSARLLERGASAVCADRDGVTPLHRALAHPDERALPLTLLLLRHGANPEAAAGSGETPLGLVHDADRATLVDWLRWRDWRLPGRKLGGHDLAAAARVGDVAAVRRLLRLGLPINGRDQQGCTALIRAAGAGHGDVLDALLGQGADAAARTAGGMTALAAAAVAGHAALAKRLLEHGVVVDQRCGNDATALVIAAACGALASVDHLLAAGARLDACDGAGNTALHAAAGFAFGSADAGASRTLLLKLLSAGTQVDAINGAGLTALHIACGAAAVTRPEGAGIGAALDVLLSRSQALAMLDSHGCAPLHYAAAHGQLDAVRRLLARGAEPLRRDHGGWRPEDYANRYGWVEVAQALRIGATAPPLPQRPA